MTYEVEKNAKEWSDKLPGDLKARLEAAGLKCSGLSPWRRQAA